MNKCVICGEDCTGQTCGGACRARLSRRTRTRTRTQDGARKHAHARADDQAVRTPEQLRAFAEAVRKEHSPSLYHGLPDCPCNACQCNESKPPAKRLTINHRPHKGADELQDNEINRVSVPGEPDYRGIYAA